ncbi:MAG: DUF4112 domain-containing protein [Planctomycetota bacterium]
MDSSRRPSSWAIKLARSLDSTYRLPGTNIRFGWDPIIGALPVAGDVITCGLSLLLLAEGVRMKVGFWTLLRMTFNIVIDFLLGLIPGVDLITDTWFKANDRNIQLLQRKAAKS